jgi:4'-phosphopantetheinyl transferase
MTITPDLARAIVVNRASGYEVLAVRLNVAPEVVCELMALLSASEQERACRFAFDRDRVRFIVARARLRQLLGMRLRMPPASVEITYGVHGKPAVARCPPDADLHFNVSHCNDVAVYAFANGRQVGVDVEAIRVFPDADDVAARFFSCRDYEAYRKLDPRDRLAAFFNCWTRREAFIKAIGGGFAHPRDHFDVSLAPHEPAAILRVGDLRAARCGWILKSFAISPDCVGAVVIETPTALQRCAVFEA